MRTDGTSSSAGAGPCAHVLLSAADLPDVLKVKQRLLTAGITFKLETRIILVGVDPTGLPSMVPAYDVFVRAEDVLVAGRIIASISNPTLQEARP